MIAKHLKHLASLVICLHMLSLTACRRQTDHARPPVQPAPPARVSVKKAELQQLMLSEELVGTVRAKDRATLEAKQPGRIKKFPVSAGDKVHAGETLIELDADESLARAEQAGALADQAEREWKRIAALFDANSATRSERDAAESRLRLARAQLAEAQASLTQLRIISPFEGVLSRKWVETGDFATPGRPLAEVENSTVLQVEIDIPESISGRVTPGSTLTIIGGPGVTSAGRVVELSPSLDTVTRTRRAKLELEAGMFSPGQFVRVGAPASARKAVVVPKSAVVMRGQLEMLFIVEAQRARMRLVKSRGGEMEQVEILAGLEGGELVVFEGAGQLTDGQLVEVK